MWIVPRNPFLIFFLNKADVGSMINALHKQCNLSLYGESIWMNSMVTVHTCQKKKKKGRKREIENADAQKVLSKCYLRETEEQKIREPERLKSDGWEKRRRGENPRDREWQLREKIMNILLLWEKEREREFNKKDPKNFASDVMSFYWEL